MKVCSKCGETKALEDFAKNKLGRYGLSSWCRECHRSAAQESYKRDKSRMNAERSKRRRENLDRENAVRRAAYAGDPTRYLSDSARRRARKRENGDYLVTDRDYRRILNSPCAGCGSTENIEVDHIVPIARGGRHAVGNLQALCRSCNASKGAKLLVQWRARRGAPGASQTPKEAP